jgi:hypothetical protein
MVLEKNNRLLSLDFLRGFLLHRSVFLHWSGVYATSSTEKRFSLNSD